MQPSGIITLLSDFGISDPFVGVMKGVILGINPQARCVDLTHAIPPQGVLAGALALRSAVAFFPPGTIHIAVVDPGVGSARRALLIEAAHAVLIGPDNGVLACAAAALGRYSVRAIENTAFFREPVSQTFHGRDIFAPVAAHCSRGIAPDAFGPPLDSIHELALPPISRSAASVAGAVIYVDHFGNLITNIAAEELARFPARRLSVTIERSRVAGPVTSYAAVPEGTPLAVVGSWGLLEVAVRNGSAAQMFAAGPGTPVTVVMESPST